jgi:hypothetical protein
MALARWTNSYCDMRRFEITSATKAIPDRLFIIHTIKCGYFFFFEDILALARFFAIAQPVAFALIFCLCRTEIRDMTR